MEFGWYWPEKSAKHMLNHAPRVGSPKKHPVPILKKLKKRPVPKPETQKEALSSGTSPVLPSMGVIPPPPPRGRRLLLVQGWSIVYDAGPTLSHHWVCGIRCANMWHSPNAVSMLTHILRRCPDIETALGDCTVFSDCCIVMPSLILFFNYNNNYRSVFPCFIDCWLIKNTNNGQMQKKKHKC